MREIDTEAISNYSWMASYLINGDSTGLSDIEEEEADSFLSAIKSTYGDNAEIVDCGDEPEFGIPEWGGLAGEIIPYTIRFEFNELPESIWDLPRNMPYLNARY